MEQRLWARYACLWHISCLCIHVHSTRLTKGIFMQPYKGKITLALACTGLLLLGSVANAKADTKVSLYLKWVPQYQFAGYLVAKSKGYYQKQGLDVDIIPGGPNINTVQEVADGAAEFGIQTPEPIFYAYSHGLKLQMLMADFQEPYEEFMVKKTSNITSLYDFKNKTIGINLGGLSQLLLPFMLKTANLTLADVHTVRKTISLAPFLSGRVPIWNGYVGNEPFEAKDMGVPVREFKMAKYVPNWYGDVLFSTAKYAASHGEIVRKFVLASEKGWEFAVKHPKQTILIIRNNNPQKTSKQLTQEASAAIPLMVSRSTKQHCFGWISRVRVQDMEENMIKFGGWKVTKVPDAKDFYTNAFLSCK